MRDPFESDEDPFTTKDADTPKHPTKKPATDSAKKQTVPEPEKGASKCSSKESGEVKQLQAEEDDAYSDEDDASSEEDVSSDDDNSDAEVKEPKAASKDSSTAAAKEDKPGCKKVSFENKTE